MELNQFRDVDIVLDKANDNIIQKQFVSAGDKDGRSLTVQITENGAVGEVIGLTLNLRWHNEASGLTDLSAFSVVDRTTSVFKIDYPQNMLTPGKVIAYIQILQDGKVTHTKPFEITVQNLAGTTRGVLATAEYSALVTTLAKANEFETEIAKKADKTQVDALGSEINVARGGAQTLGERLDSDKAEVSAQLAQITVNVSKPPSGLAPAVGDGMTDDTEALQNILDYVKENNISKIEFAQEKDYKVTKQLYNHKSNLTIDFKGSKLLWYGRNPVYPFFYKNVGVINNLGFFTGSANDVNETYRIIERLENGGNIPVPDIRLESVEKVKQTPSNKTTGSRVKTNDNAYFNIGDDVLLRGFTRETTPYDPNLFEPDIGVVTTVTNKDDEYIYVDYIPAFDMPNLVYSINRKSRILKVDLVKNVVIENLVYKDSVELLTKNNPTQAEQNSSVGGIINILCDSIRLDNFTAHNYKFNGVLNRYCRNLHQTNIKGIKPQMWDIGGVGYSLQNVFVTKSHFENVYGDGCRHVLDNSASSYITTVNAQGVNSKNNDFSVHGMVEHDLCYKNIFGTFSVGNGIAYFPEIVGKITIEDSEVKLSRSNSSYIDELLLKNSSVQSNDVFQVRKFRMENTVYTINREYESLYSARSSDDERNYYFDGEVIIGKATLDMTTSVSVYLRNVAKVLFTENTLIRPDKIPSEVGLNNTEFLKFINVGHVEFLGEIRDVTSRLYATEINHTLVSMKDNKVSFNGDYTEVKNILNGRGFSKSNISVQFSGVNLYGINSNDTSVSFVENTFVSTDVDTSVHLFIDKCNVGAGGNAPTRLSSYEMTGDVVVLDTNNIVKNAFSLPPGSRFNRERNVFV